jgi:hypothetical protein
MCVILLCISLWSTARLQNFEELLATKLTILLHQIVNLSRLILQGILKLTLNSFFNTLNWNSYFDNARNFFNKAFLRIQI